MPFAAFSPQLFHSLLKAVSTVLVDKPAAPSAIRQGRMPRRFQTNSRSIFEHSPAPRAGPVQHSFIHSFATAVPTASGDSFQGRFSSAPGTEPFWRENEQSEGSRGPRAAQASTDSFSTAFRQTAPQPLWATSGDFRAIHKALKNKAGQKILSDKCTARRRPPRACARALHAQLIHRRANRIRGQSERRKTAFQRSAPGQARRGLQKPAHSPATGCAQGFPRNPWTTQAAAPITARMSCASASTRAMSLSQEHMKRAPPAPMKV